MTSHRPERTLRIIGGNWRSRKVSFPDQPEIRPTPDRVRETLFNWLQSDIAGARCLELYAGTGILSMEALSRGADHATVIEQDRTIFDALCANFKRLEADTTAYELIHGSARQWLRRSDRPFDIVFIDPPFHTDELRELLPMLASSTGLGRSLVYVESAMPLVETDLPAGFSISRQRQAGQVHYCLCRGAH